MNIIKKYNTTLALFIISIILLLCNYIVIKNFSYSFISKEITKTNVEIINNSKELSNTEIAGFGYDDKIDLAYRYYAIEDYSKSKEICEMILKNYPTDQQTINLISAIYQQELNFDKAREYIEVLLPISTGVDLFYLYNSLSNMYIVYDIDKSIDYLMQAVQLKDDSSFVLSKNEIDSVKNKLEYFKYLKNLKDEKDSFEFFKECLESDTLQNVQFKKYLFNKYEDLYSKEYPDNFERLKVIYENLELD